MDSIQQDWNPIDKAKAISCNYFREKWLRTDGQAQGGEVISDGDESDADENETTSDDEDQECDDQDIVVRDFDATNLWRNVYHSFHTRRGARAASGWHLIVDDSAHEYSSVVVGSSYVDQWLELIHSFHFYVVDVCVCVCVCVGGGVYEKLELVMRGFAKNEGKVWGVHIIPVGNILNSSEPPRP